jgi:hypothetical protein
VRGEKIVVGEAVSRKPMTFACVRRDTSDERRFLVWCAGLFGLARSSNQINQKNQTDEMNQRTSSPPRATVWFGVQ